MTQPETGQRNRTYYAGDLRTDLITATLDAVAESGPAQVSLRDLARRLGVSHAAPKNHFADKRALFTAVATEAHRRLGGYLAAALAEPTGAEPLDALVAAGRAYLRFARENPAMFAVMWQEDLQDRSDAELLAASAQTFGPLVDLAGRLTGGVFTDQDPLRVALLAWSIAHGLADLSSTGTLADLPGADDPAGRDDQVLDLVQAIFRRAATPAP